jgi:hypothetical protein
MARIPFGCQPQPINEEILIINAGLCKGLEVNIEAARQSGGTARLIVALYD